MKDRAKELVAKESKDRKGGNESKSAIPYKNMMNK